MKRIFLALFLFLSSNAHADGIDSFVVFGSHFDGADGATSATDFSTAQAAKTITFVGNAQLDTAQLKFGTASLLLDGTGDYLTLADSDDWNFGSGDFTIDLWAWFDSVAASQQMIGQREAASTEFAFQFGWSTATTSLRFFYSIDGIGSVGVNGATFTPTLDTWYHFAVVRSGNELKLFIDGVQSGATADVTGVTIYNSTSLLQVGAIFTGVPVNYFTGQLDELRVSKGVARWTTDFTPPTAPYSAGSKNLATLGVG